MTIYDQMVAAYSQQRGTATPNVEQEVMQHLALAGLHRGGFFQYAAFYGGTCLRLFHHLPRYSEDMDFSLIEKRDDIHIESFFPAIIEEFRLAGHEVSIVKKDKKEFGRVESAFLKENTEAYDIKFQTKKTVKIKIELDTNPPFAGKMHALVYRSWQRRVKGRDWYDFEWYVRWNVPLHFEHLQERIREFNGKEVGKEAFLDLLREKLATTDIQRVKEDVIGFVDNPHELDIWSNDYFLQLADRIIFKETKATRGQTLHLEP